MQAKYAIIVTVVWMSLVLFCTVPSTVAMSTRLAVQYDYHDDYEELANIQWNVSLLCSPYRNFFKKVPHYYARQHLIFCTSHVRIRREALKVWNVSWCTQCILPTHEMTAEEIEKTLNFCVRTVIIHGASFRFIRKCSITYPFEAQLRKLTAPNRKALSSESAKHIALSELKIVSSNPRLSSLTV